MRAYEAFGTKNVEAGNDPLTYGFAGEPFDSTSNLAYHRARWMDARVGRFEGMDPMRHPGPNGAVPHLYSYASDNPVSSLDPTGQDDLESIGAAVDIVSVFATLATPSTALAATNSGWSAVTSFNVSQAVQKASDQTLNVVFDLELLGSEANVVIGQKISGDDRFGSITHSFHADDDDAPGYLWWDGATWHTGFVTQGSPPQWTGSSFSRKVRFYDNPGWKGVWPLYHYFHYSFRTWVGLRSQPAYRLGYTDWEAFLEYNPVTNQTSRWFAHTPYIED